MRAILDINVVIALLDADHVFHQRAHIWWSAHQKQGWASCALTENGVVRIMSNRAYSAKLQFSPADLIGRIRTFAANTDHEFWPDDLIMNSAMSTEWAEDAGLSHARHEWFNDSEAL